MGLAFVAALVVADISEVGPEKMPEVTPIDVPRRLGKKKEPERKEGAPPKEEPAGLLKNKLALAAGLTETLALQNVYSLAYEHYLGKRFVDKGEPLDLAHFLQKRGLADITLKAELDYSLDPPMSWEFSSVRQGGGGPFQFRFGLVAKQDSWSTSYAYGAGLSAGACLYLGPYLRLGYLYRYFRDMEEFQFAFEQGRYADSDSHAVDAALAVKMGRQYLFLEGEADLGPAWDYANPQSWRGVLSYYPVSTFSLSGEYSESAGVEGYGAGLSVYLGRRLGLSGTWTTTVGSGVSLYDARVLFRF